MMGLLASLLSGSSLLVAREQNGRQNIDRTILGSILTVQLKVADGRRLLEDLLLLVLSLTIENEEFVAAVQLDVASETT
jgi:hypothetical protein